MKLNELRHILTKYEQTWYFRKQIYGDHEEAVQFRAFLETFKHQSSDYELSLGDQLKLLGLVRNKCDLAFIKDIRTIFGDEYFFAICDALHAVGLFNEANFQTLLSFHLHQRYYLNETLAGFAAKRISLRQQLFDTCVSLIFCHYGPEQIMEIIYLLNDNNFLNEDSLKLISSKSSQLPFMLTILKELTRGLSSTEDRQKVLELLCLGNTRLLMSKTAVIEFASLAPVLNQAKIPLDQELIALLTAQEYLTHLTEFASLLRNSSNGLLTNELFRWLARQEFVFFHEKTPAIKLLQQHGLLDQASLNYILKSNVSSFSSILEVLSSNNLVSAHKTLIRKLMDTNDDLFGFRVIVNYLHKCNLLQKYFIDSFSERFFKGNCNVFGTGLYALIGVVDNFNLLIDDKMLRGILSLSSVNTKRLRVIVSTLEKEKMLNQSSFEAAFQRIAEKLPAVQESTTFKNSRKLTKLPRTGMTLNSSMVFFKDSQACGTGGFGVVKKGYRHIDETGPAFGIKKLKERDQAKARQEAIREVKYNRLLGRKAFFYCGKRATRIVSEWQNGTALNNCQPSELKKKSFPDRLSCLISALSDVNALHQHYRIHYDIKLENFILDWENLTLRLIDFGTAHKMGANKSFGCTDIYIDPKAFGDHFSGDLYAMGIVVMYLFPDIYDLALNGKKLEITLVKTQLSVHEQAIVELVNEMMTRPKAQRCSAQDALQYCMQIKHQFETLDVPGLRAIAETTIHRTSTQLEDVLRHSARLGG